MRALAVAGLMIASICPCHAQSAIPAGNTAVLAWTPNDTAEGVSAYNVYSIANGVTNKLASTSQPSIPLSMLGLGNGFWNLALSAVNVNGESGLGTNIVVQDWANRPTPPKGLMVK